RGWHIGTTLGKGSDSNHDVTSKSTVGTTTFTEHGSDIDCGVAKIEAGVSFNNKIPNIGDIKGTPPAGKLGVSVKSVVRKFGSATGFTTGTVAGFSSLNGKDQNGNSLDPALFPRLINAEDDKDAGSFTNINCLVIIPTDRPHFCDGGDS